MREVWIRLPRRALTYKLAKVVTRSVLRPAATPLLADIPIAGRFTMRVDLSDIVGNDLFCMGDHYEAPTFALWCSLAEDADTILDLGSHVGLYACAAASVRPGARVVAVEAFPRNATLLRTNCAPFPNLTSLEVAIAVSGGRRVLHVSPVTGGGYVEADGASGGASTPGGRDQTGELCEVEALALSELCERQSLARIDLMKMDLEGLETPLLTGQEEFWARWAPRHLIVEIALGRGARTSQGEIVDAMARRGYRSARLEGLHTIPWFQREDLANWHFWKTS
jgi:FkbM family methyltransferase